MVLWKCAICGSKKSRFIKIQEAKGLLSNLGVRTLLSKVPILVDLSNYVTKADIKNISHVDTSTFALKTNLANLKTEADKLDINKLVLFL